MPEEVHTVVQPEGERTQRDVSSLPIQKASPAAHYETETRVKLMFASDEYSHFYTLKLKKKSSVHGFVLSREGQDLQIFFWTKFWKLLR